VAAYEVFIKPSAAKEIEAVGRKRQRLRIAQKIQALADEPRPIGCEKLSGRQRYRIRQGDYRVVYEIDDGRRTVVVVKVGHRRDVYRSMR
jgi:mRNA interferase RelE/StbE